jgi:hypothetical protein
VPLNPLLETLSDYPFEALRTLPDLAAIPRDILERTALFYLCSRPTRRARSPDDQQLSRKLGGSI